MKNNHFIKYSIMLVVFAVLITAEEGMIVFPVLIKNCTWKVISWLKNLQMFPGDGLSLNDLEEKDRETMLINLIDQVHETFHKGV